MGHAPRNRVRSAALEAARTGHASSGRWSQGCAYSAALDPRGDGEKRGAAGPRGWHPNVAHLTQLRRPDPADSRSCRGSRRVPFGPVLELSTGPREGHSTTTAVEFDLGLFGSGLLRGGSGARSHAAEALCKACWRSRNSVSVSGRDQPPDRSRKIATSPSSARSCCSWRSASAYRSGKTSSTCAQRR